MKALRLFCFVSLLILNAAGCKKPAAKPTGPTKSLHQAAADGDILNVRLHISKGAELNAKNERGHTPLHEAAFRGRKDVAELLIAEGADVNARARGWSDLTPLHCATLWGDKSVAQLFLATHTDIKGEDGRDQIAPQSVIPARHKDIVELLLAKGADVNAESNAGWTPLHIASGRGDESRAQLLVAKGANVDAKNQRGRTPLHIAAEKGHKNMAEYLIAKGANKEEQFRFEWAAMPDSAAILRFLLRFFRLQLGAAGQSNGKYLPEDYGASGPIYTYRLSIEHDGKYRWRNASISMLGEGGGSKNRCYRVVFDTIWVIKIPPNPIKTFDDYISGIAAEKKYCRSSFNGYRMYCSWHCRYYDLNFLL